MLAARLAVRPWSISTALCVCLGCAADAGDPSKVDAGHAAITVDAGGGVDTGGADVGGTPGDGSSSASGSGTGSSGSTSSGGSSGGSSGSTSGSSSGSTSGSSSGGNDATAPPPEGGVADTGVTPDASGCLTTIPSTCPDCMTQNASDVPKCQEYLQCFAANSCNPADACATSNDGVCGVNTIGGGEAPLAAATQTYMCACP